MPVKDSAETLQRKPSPCQRWLLSASFGMISQPFSQLCLLHRIPLRIKSTNVPGSSLKDASSCVRAG